MMGARGLRPGARRFVHQLRRMVLGLLAVAALAGCSEKPLPQVLVWDFAKGLPRRRGALRTISPLRDGRVLAIGDDRPEERFDSFPICFLGSGTTWSYVPIPPSVEGGSVRLYGSTADADGTIWACGRSVDFEGKPSRTNPVLFKFTGGAWSQVPITGIVNDAIALFAIAAYGGGDTLELRCVGTAQFGVVAAALRYHDGVWSRDSLPPLPGAETATSELDAVTRDPNTGRWYASGGFANAPGGVVYTDDGQGAWRVQAGPSGGYDFLHLTSIDFDADGTPWFVGNYFIGDSLQGGLFRYSDGRYQRIPITRVTRGGYRLYAIDFDVEGNGWAVGDRTVGQPFLAGSSGGAWLESTAKVEAEELSAGVLPMGVRLTSVVVFGPQNAYAVGYGEEVDAKLMEEDEASVYQLRPKLAGEIDVRAVPTAPTFTRRSAR